MVAGKVETWSGGWRHVCPDGATYPHGVRYLGSQSRTKERHKGFLPLFLKRLYLENWMEIITLFNAFRAVTSYNKPDKRGECDWYRTVQSPNSNNFIGWRKITFFLWKSLKMHICNCTFHNAQNADFICRQLLKTLGYRKTLPWFWQSQLARYMYIYV